VRAHSPALATLAPKRVPDIAIRTAREATLQPGCRHETSSSASSWRHRRDRPEAGGGVMGAACSKTRLEGAIARWSLPSAGSRDKRVTLAACAGEPHGPPFDHSGWTAVLQAHRL
jgi:hypothetical protein